MAAVDKDNIKASKEFSFTPRDFSRVRDMIYQRAGISLSENKQDMVYSRLARRLRVLGLNSFTAYLDSLAVDVNNKEWEAFTNALTTNLTSFFRETHHFPILADFVKHRHGDIQIWCSASSTGEEPYSIAMTVCEAFNSLTPPVKIIATDIDTNVLEVAANGIYPVDRLEKMTPARVKRFFLKGKGTNEGTVRVKQALRDLVTFQPLNLLATTWPINTSFDVIFCNHVLEHVEKADQCISELYRMMKPGGFGIFQIPQIFF